MYNILKNLIEKKFYKTVEAVQTKLDVFFAIERITDVEYTELVLLVDSTYNN